MRNKGSGVKAALTHRSLTKENPIPHAQTYNRVSMFARKARHPDCLFCFKPSSYLFQKRIQRKREHIASDANRKIGQKPLLHFFNIPEMID